MNALSAVKPKSGLAWVMEVILVKLMASQINRNIISLLDQIEIQI